MDIPKPKLAAIALAFLLLGVAIGIIATGAIYDNAAKIQDEVRAERRASFPEQSLMPMSCFVRPRSFYSSNIPPMLCEWVDDDSLPAGGCWKLTDKDLCWSETDSGWFHHK